MNKDIVIDILEFGNERLEKGFSYDQLKDFLATKGHDTEDHESFIRLYRKYNFMFRPNSFVNEIEDNDGLYFLEPEGYFRLLQYRDMQNAISASNQSMRIAKDSISVAKKAFLASIFLGLISLGLGTLSYFSTKTINVQDNQIKELIKVTDEVKKSNENMINVLENIGVDIKKALAEKDSINRISEPKNNRQ